MIVNTPPFCLKTSWQFVLQYRSQSKEDSDAMDSSFKALFLKLAGVVSGWKSQKPAWRLFGTA